MTNKKVRIAELEAELKILKAEEGDARRTMIRARVVALFEELQLHMSDIDIVRMCVADASNNLYALEGNDDE